MSFVTVSKCRVCHSNDLHEFLALPSLPIGDQFLPTKNSAHSLIEQGVMVCPHCSLVTLKNSVDPAVLYSNFIYETNLSVGLSEHFIAYANYLVGFLGLQKGQSMIDIGSNDGSLLKAFKECGLKVLGFEPGSEIAARANNAGLETINGFFNESSLPGSVKVELVTANNVFANIDDLDNVVTTVKKVLAPGGVFVVETGYQIDLIQNLVFDNIYHEHISYFSLRSLKVLFDRHGMELFDVERISTKGGSIRCYVQMKNSVHTIHSRVLELIKQEAELGFDNMSAHLLFSRRMHVLKEAVGERLESLKKESRRIDGFGASVGTTTMIEYFKLYNYFERIYDDHHLKFNTFSPVRNIPTLPSSELLNYAPDVLLIMPWRYRYLIEQKHSRYLQSGGECMTILPDIFSSKIV